jgi:hypothetical protein
VNHEGGWIGEGTGSGASAGPPPVVPRLRPGSPLHTPCLEKLNRQKWTAGLAFRSYGVRVGVRVN